MADTQKQPEEQQEPVVVYKTVTDVNTFRKDKTYLKRDPFNREKVTEFKPQEGSTLSKQASDFESAVLRGLVVKVDDKATEEANKSDQGGSGLDGGQGGNQQ